MDSYQKFIEKTVIDWAHEVVAQRIAAVIKSKLVATGELAKIRFNIQRGAIKDGARLELFLREYGRIQDMKGVSFSSDTPVEKIKEWIEVKGVEKFVSKSLRIYGKIPSSKERFIHQLAWAIKSGKKKQRRRRWYSKGMWGAVYGLYDDLLISLSDPALDQLKKPLSNGR